MAATLKIVNKDGTEEEVEIKAGLRLLLRPGDVVSLSGATVTGAQVDVLTGRKTVLQYLIKPLTRMRHQALRER